MLKNKTNPNYEVSPKDIPHCIYNNSDKVARILVVKTPKPTTKTIML